MTLLGGAAAWPLAARAQQAALPIIGFVHGGAARAFPGRIAAFCAGLSEAAQTARALGLEVPPMLLARADEVIE